MADRGDPIKIGGGQAYYGEGLAPLTDLLDAGADYVMCDALAEFTLAQMQRERQADEACGFDVRLPERVRTMLPWLEAGDVTLITNGGGMNAIAAQRAVLATCRDAGVTGLKVAAVTGDDVMGLKEDLGIESDDLRFANVYLGATGIARALDEGADIVITGRTADASLALAPMLHEFGWAPDDWDLMAVGITVGHLLECTVQVTGGNYSRDWWNTSDFMHMGYPMAEVSANGDVVITKPEGSAGRVSFDTIREQLLYEVHDPRAYLNPDVCVDFTSVRLKEIGPDRVALSGIKGAPRPPELKGLACRPAGWRGDIRVGYSWPDAHAKARHMLSALKRRANELDIAIVEWCEEYFGVNGFGGPTVDTPPDGWEPPEVFGRLAWRADDPDQAARLYDELGELGLGGPPHIAWAGERISRAVTEMFSVEAFSAPRERIEPRLAVHIEVS